MMIGGCCCACKEKEVEVDEFENVTEVLSYDGASTIPPYARESSDCGYPTACGTPGTQPACDEMGFDYSILQEPWEVSGILGGSAGAGETVDKVENNYYSKTGAKVTVGNPCGYGWKGVQAKAVWCGVPGFGADECCDSGGQQQVRYVTRTTTQTMWYRVTQSLEISGTPCSGDLAWEDVVLYNQLNITLVENVDVFGNISSTKSVKYVASQTGGGAYSTESCNEESWGTGPGSSGCKYASTAIGAVPLYRNAPFTASCGIITWGCGADEVVGTPGEINDLNKWAPPSTTSNSGLCFCGDTGPDVVVMTSTGSPLVVSLSNIKITASYSGDTIFTRSGGCKDTKQGVYLRYEHFFEKTVVLSGENPYSNVIEDVKYLLSLWDLTDHKLYPWRTDSDTWQMPMVSRDAAAAGPGSGSFDVTTCEMLPTPPQYSGDIRGAPLPGGGYGKYYNFFHKNHYGDTTGGYCASCLDSIGASNPLDAAATQWTTLEEGVQMFGPGAWLIDFEITGYFSPSGGGPQDGGSVVIAQKWAETLEAWPRASSIRPCGRDRYLFDEANVGCVTSWDGTTVVLDLPVALSGTVVMGSTLYTVTGGSGSTYTLVSQSITSPVPCDGIANLRYPTARGICGRLAATAVQTSPGVVTITTAANYLRTGDTVTVAGIGGIAGGTVTVINSTSFTLSGTVTTPLTGWVHNVGITSATWDLEQPCSEHKYVVATAQSDLRNAGNVDYTFTDDTLEPTKSYPSVLYCTPNGESFPHGKSYPFGNIESDICYGSYWGLIFYQAVADPYWQQPHVPCDYSGGGWTMTNDPCGTPTANTYPFPPLVEPSVGISTLPATFGGGGYTDCYTPYSRATAHAYRSAWLACNDIPPGCSSGESIVLASGINLSGS